MKFRSANLVQFNEELAELRARIDTLRQSVYDEREAARKYVSGLDTTFEQIDKLLHNGEAERIHDA